MPLQKMQLIAGINKESTNYGNEGGWYDCDKVRFRSGNPEKIGGWTRYTDNTFIGSSRHLWNWVTINGANWLGIGTSEKYYAEQGGDLYDITPIRSTRSGLSAIFTTITGVPEVTVTITGHGAITDDWVTFSGVTATGISSVDAAKLNAEFKITYIDENSFTITLKSAATTSATGGGTATKAEFQITNGLDIYVAGLGWGAGTWPYYVSKSLTNPFTAASTGIQILTITHSAHGLTTDDYIYLSSIASDPCGILNAKDFLLKAHRITYIDANTYSIDISSLTALTTASTTASGGAVTIRYINKSSAIDNVAWGQSANTNPLGGNLRLWTADNYGQDLVFAPRGGNVYYWDGVTGSGMSGGYGAARAKSLADVASGHSASYTNVPTQTNIAMCSNYQFIILMGTQSYADVTNTLNPMLVRWSDQANQFEWKPAITNQSGEYLLSHGSQIIQAVQTRQETLIFTDSALYSMQYQGPPYVWGFQLLMDNISIMSPNVACTANGVTYWMGIDKFFMYNGTVSTLPCTVKQFVFEDMNYDQSQQFFVGGNSGYNEVWWFYCSKYQLDADGNAILDTNGNPIPNTRINKYVIYNYLDSVWYIGTMERTSWVDSGLRQFPIATNYDETTGLGYLLNHESAVDDISGVSPVAISSYITSSEFDIADGQSFGYIWRILPDVNFNASNIDKPSVDITLYPRRNSGSPYGTPIPAVYNPTLSNKIISDDNYKNQPVYTVQQFSGQVYTRCRARQIMVKIESSGLGVAWQLGAMRLDVKPDGRR